MTRFDADDSTERQQLYVDAIDAHRARESEFLTLEVDGDHVTGPDAPLDSELGVPWVQFADGIINLDCTEEELEPLESVLEEFPAFKIDEIHRPDEADGTNLQVSAKVDSNRIAQFLDAVFQRVYGLPADFRVWAVEI
ncbi:hypothetical protein [Natronobacterium gregoryi]|uniref:DUF7975 domain-containing protein n=2 Tax=Natronobacterium gregoryi TaxID=44930 RepID=L0AD94_NATGS|nr:hypothetical protein [Natronobacterium gregoryi]AFZ71404.1 hypothetical protein Natgr_0139 [Natronobacterium gregoryi SP2]ELY66929.1 hypothetical protein C490_11853 [Natronobacterium gregoryi SP2]PLK21217.1 hypothetical protein CYV19_05205 [Natronobacterium gregoryi SP2]SFI84511.1 hypothetical protein SAMN05443661_10730 [Natronobacterium gregoryi]